MCLQIMVFPICSIVINFSFVRKFKYFIQYSQFQYSSYTLILHLNAAINSRLQDSNHLVIKEKVGAEDELANGFLSSEPR